MLTVLETLWRVLDLLSLVWDLVVNWRVVVCILACLGAALIARFAGAGVGEGTFGFAALVGLLVGIAWELLAAAQRRGYV
jgi:hypothetical protein